MPKLYIAWRKLEGCSGHDMGRKLLAELYTQHVGGQLPKICTEPMGKPYFENDPWFFSISHTKYHAFCILSDRPVGIDAEEADRKIDLALAPKILSPGELAQWKAAEDPRKSLLTFWVLKEAEGKRTGQGIRIHPNGTDFVLPDSRVREIDGCLVAVV